MADVGRIAQGMEVRSSDGRELGRVDETRPSHFAVRSNGDSYWLRRDEVARSDTRSLTLGFPADSLSHHKLSDPGLSGAVPATSRERAYLPGAKPDEASKLYDPDTAPPGTPAPDEGMGIHNSSPH